jgi:hypothetical protein
MNGIRFDCMKICEGREFFLGLQTGQGARSRGVAQHLGRVNSPDSGSATLALFGWLPGFSRGGSREGVGSGVGLSQSASGLTK